MIQNEIFCRCPGCFGFSCGNWIDISSREMWNFQVKRTDYKKYFISKFFVLHKIRSHWLHRPHQSFRSTIYFNWMEPKMTFLVLDIWHALDEQCKKLYIQINCGKHSTANWIIIWITTEDVQPTRTIGKWLVEIFSTKRKTKISLFFAVTDADVFSSEILVVHCIVSLDKYTR